MSVMTFIILCGIASLVYGLLAGRSIMAAPAGSEKMANIAAASPERNRWQRCKRCQYSSCMISKTLPRIWP
jgi:Na+/H+-translocating membrane pyrophosphatase